VSGLRCFEAAAALEGPDRGTCAALDPLGCCLGQLESLTRLTGSADQASYIEGFARGCGLEAAVNATCPAEGATLARPPAGNATAPPATVSPPPGAPAAPGRRRRALI
jgi:hypothetical protein